MNLKVLISLSFALFEGGQHITSLLLYAIEKYKRGDSVSISYKHQASMHAIYAVPV